MATASGSLVSMVDASSVGKVDGSTFVGAVSVGCGVDSSLDEEQPAITAATNARAVTLVSARRIIRTS
ncbi:MAG: hypothetical protein ACI38R_22255 [Rhodococcus sp. (in: high G+C Gram-positive bacteria)]